jgi:hypothetical protein
MKKTVRISLIGQGGDIIYYAHEVLISSRDSILLGIDGLWSYYDGVSKPIPILRYSIPSE